MNYLLGCWLLLAASLASAGDARSWLDRMSHAFKEQSYQGVLIYGDARRWETMAVSHAVHDETEYEKLVHLTGEPREVIRRGHAISCTHPGDHAVRLGGTASNPLALDAWRKLGDIEGWYRLSLAGQDRIAGRAAKIVRVIPKDQHRFGYDLWLDEKTALLLRSDLVRHDGTVLERLQFAQIDTDVNPPIDDFEPQQAHHHVAKHLDESVAGAVDTDVATWLPAWLPSGFAQVNSERSSDEAKAHIATVMYTDGLAAVSVFVDQINLDSGALQRQWGATSAVVRTLVVQGTPYRITVVGEVPMVTAQRIAHSVHPLDPMGESS